MTNSERLRAMSQYYARHADIFERSAELGSAPLRSLGDEYREIARALIAGADALEGRPADSEVGLKQAISSLFRDIGFRRRE